MSSTDGCTWPWQVLKALTRLGPDQSRAYDQGVILEKECRYFMEAFVQGYLGWNCATRT